MGCVGGGVRRGGLCWGWSRKGWAVVGVELGKEDRTGKGWGLSQDGVVEGV